MRPQKAYLQPRLSPDGTKVAVAIADDGVWLWRLQQQILTRLSDGFFPVWTRDGRRLVFSASQNGLYGIFSQSPDAAGAAETLATGPSAGMLASDVTKDGRHVLFSRAGRDVMMLTIGDSTRVEPLIQTTSNERNGVVSPDERWLAYESDSSGRFEDIRTTVSSRHWRTAMADLDSRRHAAIVVADETGAVLRRRGWRADGRTPCHQRSDLGCTHAGDDRPGALPDWRQCQRPDV